MKNVKSFLFLALAFAVAAGSFSPLAFAQAAATTTAAVAAKPAVTAGAGNEMVIANFDSGEKPNNIGGDFGSWNKDPNDDTQGCNMSFEADDALGNAAGYALKLDYDVDSPNPAYNGFWMKFNGINATPYNTLNFYVRGEGLNNFTKRIKLEIKDMNNRPSPYIVSGITEKWQKISIPFEKFRRIQDWSALNEFVVVFDDINSNPKQGTILIDQITLSKE